MSTPVLHARVDRSGADTARIQVAGEVDLHTVPRLERCLTEAAGLDPAPSTVLVDLAEVGFIDSSGVNVLLGARTGLAGRGIALAVHAPADTPARRLIDLLGLTAVLRVTDPA
jgi:anti-sigma B factor antagonist